MIARYSGQETERHRIPAYETSRSLYGISRGLVVVSNYIVTGQIRKRGPYPRDVGIYMLPARPGSWESIFTLEYLAVAGTVVGSLTLGVLGNLLTDAIKTVFGRGTGKSTDPSTPELKQIEKEKPGDVDALVDAVEPSLVEAHKVINEGASKIVIIKGDNNVVTFDPKTRAYVETSSVSSEIEIQDVSVGSFNVNTGNGVYFSTIWERQSPLP